MCEEQRGGQCRGRVSAGERQEGGGRGWGGQIVWDLMGCGEDSVALLYMSGEQSRAVI